MVVEFADRVGQDPEPMRLPPPSQAATSRMEETLGWLCWLKAEQAKLVGRAEGTPWKLLPVWHLSSHCSAMADGF